MEAYYDMACIIYNYIAVHLDVHGRIHQRGPDNDRAAAQVEGREVDPLLSPNVQGTLIIYSIDTIHILINVPLNECCMGIALLETGRCTKCVHKSNRDVWVGEL